MNSIVAAGNAVRFAGGALLSARVTKSSWTELSSGSGADIVWVGPSTPKQELWMQRTRPRLDAPVLMSVWAALEWRFGLLNGPRRLWRRLKNNPRFVALMIVDCSRGPGRG